MSINSGDESEGKQSSTEGWKEEMAESHSQQAALAVQAGSEPHGKEGVKHMVPHPTAPTGQQHPAWKVAGRSRLPLTNPQLIPSEPFPFIIVLFSS